VPATFFLRTLLCCSSTRRNAHHPQQAGQLMTPNNVNPVQWQQTLGYARNVCARVFRDGGKPADALMAFGLQGVDAPKDWATVVDRIAMQLVKSPVRKAA
jgi:hypothetical protein